MRVTKNYAYGVVVLALVLLGTPAELRAQTPTRVALVGGMLLDGYEVPPLHHAAVLIEGNTIVWVGRAAEATIPSDATVIDTRGRVMLPGLIDLHGHLSLLGSAYPRWWQWVRERDVLDAVMELSAKQLLRAGVTSVVDLGSPLEESLRVRDRVARGEIPGPRLWMAGLVIPRKGEISGDIELRGSFGRPDPQMGNQKRPFRSGEEWWAYPPGTIDTPEDAARVTDELARAGVDVIKAYTNLTPAHYRAILETAHRHNLRVHAHVYDEQDVRNALEAGVDVLTHTGSAGTTPPYTPELIRDVVNAGRPVVITATHRSWIFPATVGFPERLQDPQLKEDFAAIPGLWEEVQSSLEQWHTISYFQRVDREMFFRERGLKQFIEAGAVMGMGTDPSPANFNTEALWREIKAHVDMGMSPQRAISAATRINARILGRGSDLGTIEPGKLADIIVVRGNPLFNIMALADVEVVVKDGVVYKGGPTGR
jgi:imidazolonepropionase-like amidohydrolase